jgi:hypothetical protein
MACLACLLGCTSEGEPRSGDTTGSVATDGTETLSTSTGVTATEDTTDTVTTTASTTSGTTGNDASTTAATTSDDSTTTNEPCRRIYVALTGVTLTSGEDDAPNDVSAIVEGVMPPYDGDGQALVAALQAMFAPFAVCVTDERPAEGPYDMVVFTDDNPFGTGVLGISALDCMDENPSNVVVVFTDVALTDDQRARIAASRLGTTMGVNNQSANSDDLAFSAGAPEAGAAWLDLCIPFEDIGSSCATFDACPDGQQNSFAHLTEVLGPA